MKRYNNYHKHSHYSNISTIDSCTKPIDYILRAKELGHTTYFTTEHGWQGNIYEAFTLCQEYNLKCIYGVEAYYCDDMYDKGNRNNYHIMLIAKNENGRKQINKIISKANTDGYYYKARVDLQCLLSLIPNDVIVTTACIAGRLFKGNWLNEFFLPVLNHFKDNFYLEIQSHNDSKQIEYNKKILELSERYNVKIIHANDSHYIKPDDSRYRDMLLKAKGFDYPDESNFLLDYPDYDEIVKRYQIQGVLSNKQIYEALDNTLIFDEVEPIYLDKDIKLPKIIEGDSDEYLKKLLFDSFNNEIKEGNIPKDKLNDYIEAVKYEYDIVKKCNMADYFILNHKIIKLAVEKYNAVLTKTGRGSAPSFYINRLLGLTRIDRLKSPIKLYPTRFMSAERILLSKSLPDIDINLSSNLPALQASKDILGDDNIYFMVAYGTMKDSQAFKMWCKALDMDFNEYNEVGKNIDEYREDKKWSRIIEDSKIFIDVIDSISPSSCSFLLLSKPISEEVGLIKVGDVICCCLDGYNCDVYKYVKNDFLQVTCYLIISEVYKKIGRDIDDISELMNKIDDKVWKMIGDGMTTTINQCDSDYDKQILKRYKPHSLGEMSAYVASIRPGFISLLNNFIERKPYTTGVNKLDDLLKDSFHYLMYQESIMTYLTWLGIEEKETYDIIKKISKKKFKQKELDELKTKLLDGWYKQVGDKNGFDETWKVVESAANYSFNASHSLSVAIDGLYGAYLKVNYPLEYFTVVFNIYKDDERKTKELTKELSYFNLKLKPIEFGKSISDYTMDKENNTIYKGIASIKYCNSQIAGELYELSKNHYDNFIDLLYDIKEKTSVNKKQLIILIKLNYFKRFGNNNKLLEINDLFNTLRKKKQIKKADIEKIKAPEYVIKKYSNKETEKMYKELDTRNILFELINSIKNNSISIIEQMQVENEYLGYIEYTNKKFDKHYYYVKEFSNSTYYPKLVIRNIQSGEEISIKIKDLKLIRSEPIKKSSIIYVKEIKEVFKKRPNENGKWVAINETEPILTKYFVINDK